MQNRKNTANKKLTRKGNKKNKQENGKTSKHDNTRNIKPVQIKTNTNKWKQIKKIMQMIQKSRKI